ncbi:MAG: hypothetical protein ACJA2W_003078 [Planctomycetota bacterium]|jgi:hypothetical protein
MSAQDLTEALAKMSWSLEHDEFALVGFTDPPTPEDVELLTHAPSQLIRERDETTLLVRASDVDAVRLRHPDLRSEAPLLWIRFEAAMGWEVVGFLAHVTSALAAAGIPIGAVCSFSRDHLFVNAAYRSAMAVVLDDLFPRQVAP